MKIPYNRLQDIDYKCLFGSIGIGILATILITAFAAGYICLIKYYTTISLIITFIFFVSIFAVVAYGLCKQFKINSVMED